jgi:hypothetical protein
MDLQTVSLIVNSVVPAHFLDTWPFSMTPAPINLRTYWIDNATVRHNNTYSRSPGPSNGQTEENRSENRRAETDRYSKSSSRYRLRHTVQRESVLRPQGSPSGPIRDAAPAQHRGGLDRRRSGQLWCFASNGLPNSVGIRKSRSQWPTSQTPRTEGRTQALRRGHRLCANFAGSRRQLDHRRLYPGDSGTVCNQSASTQSGESVHEQKKTTRAGLESAIPEGTVEAYEGLRRQVIQPDGRVDDPESRVVLRSGLAAWARLRPATTPLRPPVVQPKPQSDIHNSPGAELVRLVAGLILSIRLEDYLHA